jgi:ATPase subunit of ABC transporter with duplicated ATPase domains
VKALSEALCGWGNNGDGAVVVISHDRAFCEKVGFTHVATISDGKLVLEQRSMRDDDWKVVKTTLDGSGQDDDKAETMESVQDDPVLRKKLFNAPKRISKLESLIEKAEEEIAAIDKEMLKNGSHVGKLVVLSEKKESLEEQITEYMEEWEQLEALLAKAQ